MKRHSVTRAVAGPVLLVLAVVAVLLSRGIADAARDFRNTQAHWQRGLAPHSSEPAGRAQTVGEHLLGVRTRAQLLRAYVDYRAGLASVIEGTLYPQTQARWNAISAIGALRPSLSRAEDRAAADVTLGTVYAASATASGPGRQRQTLLRNAMRAFARAVRGDPSNAVAKYDLEVLLAAAAEARAQARRREAGKQDQKGRPTPTPQSQPAGSGY